MKRSSDFTILPNAMLRDASLSFRARGLLAMILTNVDEWRVYANMLKKQGTEGTVAIRTALHELEAAGYAVCIQHRDEHSRFSGVTWTFHDAPVAVELRSTPSIRSGGRAPEHPENQRRKPGNAKPLHGKPNAKKNQLEEESKSEESKETLSHSRSVFPFKKQTRRFEIPAEWKPDDRSKDEQLLTRPMPRHFPSQSEYEDYIIEGSLVRIDAMRPDLYRELCVRKWCHWDKRYNRWTPIRDWHAYLAGLEQTLDANMECSFGE